MATELGQAYVQIVPSARGISASMTAAINPAATTAGLSAGTTVAKNMGQKISAVGKKFVAAGAIATAISVPIIKGIKDSLSAYEVQATAETKLTEIYKTRMGASDAAAKKTIELAGALQKQGIIGDEVAISGAQQLATFAKYPSTINTLLPAMNNLLAQQKGVNATEQDAVNIGNLMGKVMQGQTGALKRVGISFTEAQEQILKYGTEEEKAAVLAEVITSNVGNMNQTLADTPAGKMKQLSNSMGDIKESIGSALAPVIADLSVWISEKLVPAFEKAISIFKANPVFAKIAVAIAGILAVGGPLLMFLGSIMMVAPAIGAAFTALMGPIGIIIAAVAAVIAIGIALYKNWDKVKAKTTAAWKAIKSAVSEAVEKVKTVITTVFNAIKTVIQTALTAYVTMVKARFQLIKTTITTIINAIKTVITTVFNAIKTVIQTALTAYVTLVQLQFNAIKTVITTVINAVKTVITTVFNAIKTVIQTALVAYVTLIRTQFTIIKTTITTIITAVKTTITTVFNAIKTTIGVIFGAIKNTATTMWNSIKAAITTPIDQAKNSVSKIVDAIKVKVSGAFSGISGKVKSAFDAVKTAITGPLETARDKVRGILDKIKGFFPLSIGKIFSNLKLPHISVSGGSAPFGIGGKGSLPKFSVSWYKKAEDNPYMFSKATLFGAGEGTQDEILYGRKSLMRDIQEASKDDRTYRVLVEILRTLSSMSDQEKAIVFNNREFARLVNEVM